MTQQHFVTGQRWVSDTEAELGLGIVLDVENRRLTLGFPAAGERRTYALDNAPVSRVRYQTEEKVRHQDGTLITITEVLEQGHLLAYRGFTKDHVEHLIPEFELDSFVQFSTPRERLFSGQIDKYTHFALRHQTQETMHRHQHSAAYGLAGPRVQLLPHQLYIAKEVARRHAPRVLLADEVGLGKTIEAGLILHRLLLTGRVERALVLVPASLTHQWLVELLRRFALEVTLLDEQQSLARAEGNPFESGQLILASQEWLFNNPHRQEQASACHWDLLIVDEAHHLDWSDEQIGPGYACVEGLAQQTPGVLLLTATPEQMGLASHFARLRLLDPDRYHSLDAFREEEQHYVAVAQAIDALETLPEGGKGGREVAHATVAGVIDEPDSLALLNTLSNPESSPEQQTSARDQLREQLLDRHGTGRVMFRNSRRHVGGFPERRLHLAPLELPAAYRRILRKLERNEEYLDELLVETGLDFPDLLIYPDATYRAMLDDLNVEPWWQIDTRVKWLLERLGDDSEQGFADDKVLVIAHSRETAQGLAEALRVLGGIHAPVFHEGLTLVERDRAAAAFADEEEGSQVLVCSEIGSEGRNFQFCRQLVMFDLPQHPDQLEQRIGRLDRIGQRHAIEIHVPLFTASPGERLLRWFREGMDAFAAPHGIGKELFDAFGAALAEALLDGDALAEVVTETRALFEDRLTQRDAGRNRLLELNACRPARAEAVTEAIRSLDADPALPRYLDQALDIFGVDSQELGGGLLHLRPSPQMLDGLPGLAKDEEGFTATLSRERALARDDVQRLSWEHPLLREMMGRILDGNMGNTALALLKHPAIPPGRLMTELVFRTYCPAPKRLHVNRFLPPTAIRVLLDESGAVLSDKISFTGLAKNLRRVKKAMARDLIRSRHDQLRELLGQGEQEAERELPRIVEAAQERMRHALGTELTRLEAVARLNPAVRPEELEALRRARSGTDAARQGTRL